MNRAKSNVLYYGDNLVILQKYIDKETVDLIYLDPPFNSKADYNILFREATGEDSAAQIQAFSDFWHWDIEAKHAYDYLVQNAPNDTASLVEAFFNFLGKNDLMAYLVMMGVRLLELHRVLRSTGSLFLHCDPTAGHYLKLLMDAIFGPRNFRNEIIWKRTYSHGGARRLGPVHDVILFYSRSEDYVWNPEHTPYSEEYVEEFFKFQDPDGRRYRSTILTGSGTRGGASGKPWRSIDPTTSGRHWAIPGYVRPLLGEIPSADVQAALDKLDEIGRMIWPTKRGGVPSFKQYLDDFEGVNLQDIWTDLPPISSHAKERLGYPTQKPSQLLERIIKVGSNPGDVVLDPFCGCGTAIVAAEKLRRYWIGIDITYLAINLVKIRLNDSFPDAQYSIEGEPRDIEAAKELAKNRYQFQWWALSLLGARPVGSTQASPLQGRKGPDEGVDGWLRFADGAEGHMERIVVQVKSGHVGVKDIRELRDVVSRQNAAIGIFVTLEDPTTEMLKEVRATDPYVSPRWNHEYPRIQIMAIQDLLRRKRPEMPPIVSAFQEAPMSKRVTGKSSQETGLEDFTR